MHIFENSFQVCHFIGASASFTPHSDSEHLLYSEPLSHFIGSAWFKHQYLIKSTVRLTLRAKSTAKVAMLD